MSPEYIVICQQVVGGAGVGFTTAYNWDRKRFQTSKEAVSHGFEIGRSDDFNVGVLFGNQLTQFRWMDKPLDGYDLDAIAQQIGLSSVSSSGDSPK